MWSKELAVKWIPWLFGRHGFGIHLAVLTKKYLSTSQKIQLKNSMFLIENIERTPTEFTLASNELREVALA